MCLYDRFVILHCLFVLLWNFTISSLVPGVHEKVIFTLDKSAAFTRTKGLRFLRFLQTWFFFLNFSRKYCPLGFKVRKIEIYFITLYLLSMLQERARVSTILFLFVEPGSRNWKSVSQWWLQCKLMFYSVQFFYCFFICL